MNKEFYINNRKKLRKQLKGNYIALFYSGVVYPDTADENFDFSVNRNFYYLTGINQDNVILMLVKGETKEQTILFVEENDPVMVKWYARKLEFEEASEISGITDVRSIDSFDDTLYFLLNPSRKNFDEFDTLYLDLERRKDLDTKYWGYKFSQSFKKDYPEVKIQNAYSLVVKLRQTKENDEVKLIQESIKTTLGGLNKVMENIKPNMYEYQIESYFDQYIKYDGQKPHSFKTICACGKNATVLHYSVNNTLIKDNDLVLFDLGCQTNFYISDITRCYPANGKFTERQKQIYNIVLNCNKKCIEWLKPGVTWAEYNNYANSLLIKGLKEIGLIKKDEELQKYYWHSIGHSIGLDTHDPSIYSLKFAPGMLTTVEPGLYLEDEGIGIRIEDDILITEDGCINLSKDIIKEVDEIEDYMAKNNICLK